MWQFTYTLTSLELHSPTWGSSRTVWAFPTFQRSFSELLSFTVVWRQRWDWSSQDLFRFLLQSVFHERHFVMQTEHQLLPLDTRANSFLPIPPPVLCKWLLVLCRVCVCLSCVIPLVFGAKLIQKNQPWFFQRDPPQGYGNESKCFHFISCSGLESSLLQSRKTSDFTSKRFIILFFPSFIFCFYGLP